MPHLNTWRISWRCNLCEEEGRRRLVFSCRECELDLCLPCALSRVSDSLACFRGSSYEDEASLLGIPTRANTDGDTFALVTWNSSTQDRFCYAPGKSLHYRDES
jgi:hypothetical protein